MDEARLTADNLAVDAGWLPLDEFARRRADEVRAFTASSCPPVRAVAAVLWIGMTFSSLERHRILAGLPPEWTRAVVPDAEALLVRLAAGSGPPRDVLRPYLDGPCFLGISAELRFKSQVKVIADYYGAVHELLAPLTDPGAWDRAEAADRLDDAQIHLAGAASMWRVQARVGEDERRGFRRTRGFFRSYTVGGVLYEGINAAHEPAVATADVLLGSADDAYLGYLPNVRRHLLVPDAKWFDRVLRRGSIAAALAERLGITSFDYPHATEAVEAAPLSVRHAAAAWAAVLRAHATASSAHAAVITNVLTRDEPASPEETVTPIDAGSGGRAHEATRRLVEMRKGAAATATRLFTPPSPTTRPGAA